MITVSLVVYLCISLALLFPFVLRYLVVLRHERDSGINAVGAPRPGTSGHALF